MREGVGGGSPSLITPVSVFPLKCFLPSPSYLTPPSTSPLSPLLESYVKEMNGMPLKAVFKFWVLEKFQCRQKWCHVSPCTRYRPHPAPSPRPVLLRASPPLPPAPALS